MVEIQNTRISYGRVYPDYFVILLCAAYCDSPVSCCVVHSLHAGACPSARSQWLFHWWWVPQVAGGHPPDHRPRQTCPVWCHRPRSVTTQAVVIMCLPFIYKSGMCFLSFSCLFLVCHSGTPIVTRFCEYIVHVSHCCQIPQVYSRWHHWYC